MEAYVPVEDSEDVDDNVDEEYDEVRCRAMICVYCTENSSGLTPRRCNVDPGSRYDTPARYRNIRSPVTM